MVGIIQKATQGTSYRDPTYQTNFQQAQSLSLIWGAYHFGNGDDGIAQADSFLNAVQPAAGTLLVLDFESNTAGSTMSLQDAEDFVTHIQAATGIWPGLYGGSYLKEQLGSQADPICRIVGYGSRNMGQHQFYLPDGTIGRFGSLPAVI